MTRRLRLAAASALLLVLAGCAAVTDAPAGAFKISDGYQVTLGREWSDISKIMNGRPQNVRLLSIDGPLLNRLYISDGLNPGEFLVKPASAERPTPAYHKDMSPNELVEFVADSVSALEYERVETRGLRPAKVGATQGLRFDIAAKTRDGLEIGGTAQVAEVGGRLYVILYLAPAEHYFAANLPDVEAVMSSARPSGA
jgi:hypothetical protein